MTKRTFNKLLKETKRHWEEDIIRCPAKKLKNGATPINMASCAVCRFFKDNCDVCFLGNGECLYEVCDANDCIRMYRYEEVTAKEMRVALKKAYEAILTRFDNYEKENFPRKIRKK